MKCFAPAIMGTLMGSCALATCSALAAPPSRAGVTCQELNRLWITQYRDDFGAGWAAEGGLSCPSVESSIAEAMYELDYSRFVTAFGGQPAPDFYEWTHKAISWMWRLPEMSSSPNALMSTSRGNVTVYDIFARHPLELRTSSLVHEARHCQRGDPGHVNCSHGNMMETRGACDAYFEGGEFPNSGGGYSYSFAYALAITRAGGKTDLSKEIAKTRLKDLIVNRFNEVSNEDVQKYSK